MNKFTPGPWKAVADERYDRFAEADRIVGYDIKSADGEIVGSEGISGDSEINLANPATITALTAELRRLRAENEELAQSLAESRANDQASMGWLTSLRWASGDRGERMLPELVTHIEGLAKYAWRYRWLRDSIWYVGPDDFYCGEGGDMNEYENHNSQAETLDSAIDTAMAAQ